MRPWKHPNLTVLKAHQMETTFSDTNCLKNKFHYIVNKNTIYRGIVEQSKEHLSFINRQYTLSACVCTYVLVQVCVCVLASAWAHTDHQKWGGGMWKAMERRTKPPSRSEKISCNCSAAECIAKIFLNIHFERNNNNQGCSKFVGQRKEEEKIKAFSPEKWVYFWRDEESLSNASEKALIFTCFECEISSLLRNPHHYLSKERKKVKLR